MLVNTCNIIISFSLYFFQSHLPNMSTSFVQPVQGVGLLIQDHPVNFLIYQGLLSRTYLPVWITAQLTAQLTIWLDEVFIFTFPLKECDVRYCAYVNIISKLLHSKFLAAKLTVVNYEIGVYVCYDVEISAPCNVRLNFCWMEKSNDQVKKRNMLLLLIIYCVFATTFERRLVCRCEIQYWLAFFQFKVCII